MMDQQTIDTYKEKLIALREELEGSIAAHETPPQFEEEPGLEDEMNEAEEMANQSSIAQQLRQRLAEVEHALHKIEKGTYGICEETGEPIPQEVLEVNPEARFHPDVLKNRA